jgi:hypothetical protein
MWVGVTSGLAGKKLSECPNKFGKYQASAPKAAKVTRKMNASL